MDFTRDLAGQTTEFGGASSSLDVREGADDLLNRRIYPMGLIQVLDGFWGETKFGQGNEAFDEKEDNKPPLYLAACVIRGAESDDRFAANTSRMVVISNTDFLEPRYQSAENLDFLASSVNWLVGREALAGIGPRSLGTYKLPLLDAQVSFINRVNLFFLPAFLVLIGGLRLVVAPCLTRHALPRLHLRSCARRRRPLRTWRAGNGVREISTPCSARRRPPWDNGSMPHSRPSEVKHIRISDHNTTAAFSLRENGWQAATPWADRMDPRAAVGIINFTLGLRVEDFTREEKIDPAQSRTQRKRHQHPPGRREPPPARQIQTRPGHPMESRNRGLRATGGRPSSSCPATRITSTMCIACTGDITPLFKDGLKFLRDHRPFYFNPVTLRENPHPLATRRPHPRPRIPPKPVAHRQTARPAHRSRRHEIPARRDLRTAGRQSLGPRGRHPARQRQRRENQPDRARFLSARQTETLAGNFPAGIRRMPTR